MILKLLGSQLFANLIQVFVLLITIGVLIVTRKTFISDINQRKISNTLEYIRLFLNDGWISNEDKYNWNVFFRCKLIRNACGDFSLTGEYKTMNGNQPILNVFSEGYDEKYGKSIINILNTLEYIAIKTLKNELDIDLIKINLLRFYQLADYYIKILEEDTYALFYPNIKQLYKNLKICFGTNEPYGNYCEFPLELNRK